MLWRLYKTTLKEKFEAQKVQIPSDPTGKPYGKYLVNRHGVGDHFAKMTRVFPKHGFCPEVMADEVIGQMCS